MELLEHPAWTRLREHLVLSLDKATAKSIRPRYRINVSPDLPKELRDITIHCQCGCGREIHPVRGMYLALSSPLTIDVACARRKPVSAATDEVVAALFAVLKEKHS